MANIPEDLLRRSAEARAKALGVPVEEVLASMGLIDAPAGPPPEAAPAPEPPPSTVEEPAAEAPEPAPVEEPEAPEPTPVEPSMPAEAATPPTAAAPTADTESKIPEALLRRSAEAKAKATGRPVEEIMAEMRGGAAPAAEPAAKTEPAPVAEQPAAAEPTPTAEAPPVDAVPEPSAPEPAAPEAPAPATSRTTTVTAPPVVPPQGTPEGVRPQRLLTVVRARAIQQVKAEPTDKVNVWPHLLLIEFVALLAVTAILIVLSVILQAPLLELANFNATPNPSKAPWYFLGLQELLTYFDPQIAGVIIPTVVGLIGLMAIPYVDRNPSTKPADRKFAIMFFTFFLVASATLTIIGVLFRGPGFNFSYPWSDGIWFDDLKDWVSFE